MDDGAVLETELSREVAPEHPLYALSAVAIGRRIDCDDVLFQLRGSSQMLAVVRLTWCGEPESDFAAPPVRFYRNWHHWSRECMLRDNAGMRLPGPPVVP